MSLNKVQNSISAFYNIVKDFNLQKGQERIT